MLRLKIAHQLSLLMAAAAVLAVLVVGGLSAYNLRSGFSDYLKVRDDEQLMRLVALIEQHAATDPDFDWLRDKPEAMRALLDEFAGRPSRGQRPPPPRNSARPGPPDENGRDRPPPGAEGRPPPRPTADEPPPPRPGGGGGGPGSLGDRVLIRDREGRKIAGRPLPPNARTTVRAIKVNGQEVAYVDLMAEPAPAGVDALFLQRQTRQLWWAALASIVLAVGAAWWMAGRWSRPLLALQRASRDIAGGQHTQALVPTGALEIAQLMEDINRMTAELARLEAARRTWIAQISHELRTPLSVLRGELEAIEDGARTPTPAVLAGLRDEVLQLNRLVDDLHTLSVADLGGMRCALTQGDAHAELWRVAQRFAAQATFKGLVLRMPPESAPPIPVHWDFGRIEQLVSNLLTNSLRYTNAPGTVVVDWRCDGRDVVITVDDSAPGLSPADLKELFEPLFRGDRARQRGDQHGSGLGLSIARSIAQAHQGTISASASPRGGLQMRVCLPLQPDAAADKGKP
jgi:two-component system sensor histidine kinase BaeS